MSMKIQIDDKEYDIEQLSKEAQAIILSMKFVDSRLTELKNLQAVLQRSKHSYLEGIKKEMLTEKAGFLFADDEEK
jgi:hypothetical protein